MRLEVAGDTPAASLLQVLQDIRNILKGNEKILEDFIVNLHDFTKDTYVIQIIYMTYVIEGIQYNALRSDVNIAVVKALENRGAKLSSTKVEINSGPVS
jgi:MscS family membrane protein